MRLLKADYAEHVLPLVDKNHSISTRDMALYCSLAIRDTRDFAKGSATGRKMREASSDARNALTRNFPDATDDIKNYLESSVYWAVMAAVECANFKSPDNFVDTASFDRWESKEGAGATADAASAAAGAYQIWKGKEEAVKLDTNIGEGYYIPSSTAQPGQSKTELSWQWKRLLQYLNK